MSGDQGVCDQTDIGCQRLQIARWHRGRKGMLGWVFLLVTPGEPPKYVYVYYAQQQKYDA
eukprot:scaffold142624_cov316-Phaeocystis_antarctica.AAC.1